MSKRILQMPYFRCPECAMMQDKERGRGYRTSMRGALVDYKPFRLNGKRRLALAAAGRLAESCCLRLFDASRHKTHLECNNPSLQEPTDKPKAPKEGIAFAELPAKEAPFAELPVFTKLRANGHAKKAKQGRSGIILFARMFGRAVLRR